MNQHPLERQRLTKAIDLWVSEEDVVVHVRGFAVLRASFEAEGYYDEAADGDPEEQDLYRVEVLDAPRATRAAEAVEEGPVWPLMDLGLDDFTVYRLFPASRWTPDGDELLTVKRYLLVLALALKEEETAERRQRQLVESTGWSVDYVAEAFNSLPTRWQAILTSTAYDL